MAAEVRRGYGCAINVNSRKVVILFPAGLARSTGHLHLTRRPVVPCNSLIQRFRNLLPIRRILQHVFIRRTADERNLRENRRHGRACQHNIAGFLHSAIANARCLGRYCSKQRLLYAAGELSRLQSFLANIYVCPVDRLQLRGSRIQFRVGVRILFRNSRAMRSTWD